MGNTQQLFISGEAAAIVRWDITLEMVSLNDPVFRHV